MQTISVLFICLGNICRSPMAHGIFEHLVEEAGVADRFSIESCGTGSWHVGERPDPRTIQELGKHGIPLDHHALRLKPDDGARYDWLLTMDGQNLRDVKRIIPEQYHHKIHAALSIAEGGDVPDPYYGGRDGFAVVYRLLDDALRKWLDRMLAETG